MKTFFTVKQADDTESYSGRFNVNNEELDISTDNYDLQIAITEFISKFKSKYNYWHGIYDVDVNKEALKKSSIFMSYDKAYGRC